MLLKMTDSWLWVRRVWEGGVIGDKECLWMCGLLFRKLKMCILLRHMQNNKCFPSTLLKAAGREKSRFIPCRIHCAMYILQMACSRFVHVTVTLSLADIHSHLSFKWSQSRLWTKHGACALKHSFLGLLTFHLRWVQIQVMSESGNGAFAS